MAETWTLHLWIRSGETEKEAFSDEKKQKAKNLSDIEKREKKNWNTPYDMAYESNQWHEKNMCDSWISINGMQHQTCSQ